MVLSDRTIAARIAAGRIRIDPYDESLLQPSSIDVRVDSAFRVFHNARYPYIDVKEPQEALTELVEIAEDEPFILHPGEFVLGSTLERVTLPDDLVARLEGKALALDTEVPTPSGWKTMADLEVGDLVFSELGEPTVVLAATRPMLRRPCVEVSLSDGTRIVCDESHQWVTSSKSEREHSRRSASVRTAREIGDSLRVRGELNHRIRLAGAAQYPERELPIDPYVLGAWLGDGTSTAAETACADRKILEEVEMAGYAGARTRTRRLVRRVGGDLGVLGDKHIPELYLRSSVDQRLALLQGLMDTDGYVDELGRCDLTTVREGLALQYCELVASLGFRPTLARKRAVLDGRDRGSKLEVQFMADEPIEGRFDRFRAVVDVRRVESVPVRCIQVSAPSGQFLVTRRYVPTHNSSLGRLGLLIHSTAGFIDPGFDGHVTLELSNVANLPITIYHGMKIGQISFMQMTEPASTPYGSSDLGSKYQGQRGPTPSRYYENFRRS